MYRVANTPLIAAMVLLLAVACNTENERPTSAGRQTPPKNSKADEPASSEGTPGMKDTPTSILRISAAESASHQLPAADITLDYSVAHMTERKFPAEDQYLSLSGPPGMPLGMKVSHVVTTPTNKAEWESLVEQRYAKQLAELGTAADLKISGAARPAFTCTTGKSHARAHHVLVLIAVPKSKAGILVDFYHRAGKTETPTPQAMAVDGRFAPILQSLSVRFEE
jgi:hypothetical protein